MNILIAAPFGMYRDYTASFVHRQAVEIRKLGNSVRVIVPAAVMKKGNEGTRFYRKVTKVCKEGAEIYYISYISTAFLNMQAFNENNAVRAVINSLEYILKDFSPDVIHAHGMLLGACIGSEIKKRCKFPLLIVTTHGSDTLEAVSPKRLRQTEKLCRNIDGLICVSEKLKKIITAAGLQCRIVKICNGFAAENLIDAEKSKGAIIQAGHLIKSKHFDTTLRSIRTLRDDGLDVCFYIVGDGREKRHLINLAKALDIRDSVIFKGAVSNQELLRLMAESEFFILPSYPEGFGIVYLEAMASGCVTIGTKKEGISELIEHGVNGFLVDRDDDTAIAQIVKKVISDDGMEQRICENAKSSARRFSWKRNALECLEYYQSFDLKRGNL